MAMAEPTVRTSLDIRAVEETEPQRPPRRLSLDPPLIPSRGKPFDLTNEQIHELIEFP